MGRKQLILVYAIFLFMMVWGFDLLTTIKYGEPYDVTAFWNIFNLCALFYAGSTLLLVRAAGIKFYRTRRYGLLLLGLLGTLIYFMGRCAIFSSNLFCQSSLKHKTIPRTFH